MALGISKVPPKRSGFVVTDSGNIISTALFISSSMKLLPILTAIWEYDVPASARAVGWAVVVNNIEALTSISSFSNDRADVVLLETTYMNTLTLSLLGA